MADAAAAAAALMAEAQAPAAKPALTSGKPKDAATLLIVRTDDGAETRGTDTAPRVLMGRRHRGHAFMPDKWVFPGGRIDRADFGVPAASELSPPVAAALERTTSSRRARALACAAIRETFEETGLLLAKAAAPDFAATARLAAEPMPVEQPRPAAKRTGVWGEFLARGLPDLAALDFVARAITPPARTRRFDARFFMADAGALVSLDPGAGSGELDELAWFYWETAAGLDLPNITRAILAEAALRLADPARAIPYHHFRRGKHRLEVV